jgi:hypothetical protein
MAMERGILQVKRSHLYPVGLALAAAVIFSIAAAGEPEADKPEDTVAPAVESPGAGVSPGAERILTIEMLDRSLAVGGAFLLNNQRDAGNFNYEYDFVAEGVTDEDNAVRQAGALWGLSLLHLANPSPETAQAVARGLKFYRKHDRKRGGMTWPLYPEQTSGQTNMVALLVLAMVDLLRDDDLDAKIRHRVESQLDRYLRFLLSLRRSTGLFYGRYNIATGQGMGASSPYADGEALLAMLRAARYAGARRLKATILASAKIMHIRYVKVALERDRDSNTTKGFYQWGSMAFFEIHDAGWDLDGQFARNTIDMAHWMIDVHRTLRRSKNTGYAHEGIAVACELARRTGDEAAATKFADVVRKGLYKLTSWQVGGPNPNQFLLEHPTEQLKAVGGVMNSAHDPVLRIDVTQHQMHAVILAKRYVFEQGGPRKKRPAQPDR